MEEFYDKFRAFPRDETLPEEQGMETALDLALGALAGAAAEEAIAALRRAAAARGARAAEGAGSLSISGTGKLGGRVLTSEELTRVEAILESKGVALEPGSPRLAPRASAQFDPVPGGPLGQPAVLLGPNPTEYELLHELMHVEQWEQLGAQKFSELSRLEKEMFAYNRLRAEFWDHLSAEERVHAQEYILRVIREAQGAK